MRPITEHSNSLVFQVKFPGIILSTLDPFFTHTKQNKGLLQFVLSKATQLQVLFLITTVKVSMYYMILITNECN